MDNHFYRETILQPVFGAVAASNSALVTFGIYMVVVFLLAGLSGRVLKKRNFIGEYFLGSRNLGLWAFALTFAATSASGGSFMGFPSRIYTHGWVLAFWISSYMVVPLVAMGLLAKRLNQVARIGNAVTIPEVFRERFGSRTTGLVATSLLSFFMFFYILAQFKAGSKILTTLFGEVQLFQQAVLWTSHLTEGWVWFGSAEPDYLLCLMIFSAVVIVYTAYGGFRAVVWTDVMQGILMGVGVIIMLGLALYQVGGLSKATREMAEMTTPENGKARLFISDIQEKDWIIPKGTWLRILEGPENRDGIVRTAVQAEISAGQLQSEEIEILKITSPSEIKRISPDDLSIPVEVQITDMKPYRFGGGRKGVYVTAPGPDPDNSGGFLSIWLAMSFFVFWAFGGAGQPSNMVRLMAFRSSAVLKKSIFAVSIYYTLIYGSLVVVFCCARILLPGMEIDSDRVMPDMATLLTANAGVPWLAGLLVAAPFAAVMSSVDSFLLVLSSALVRDVYQRNINPDASDRKMKKLTYLVTGIIGILATLVAVHPPKYLQDLIIFATSGLAACFLVPMFLGLYWPRMTASGTIAGMIGGCVTHLLLYIIGYVVEGRFAVYYLLGFQPFLWDVLGSALVAVLVSLKSKPPAPEIVDRYFRGN